MRLELRQTAGLAARAPRRPWTFDRGRRSLGGSPDCDWVIEDQDGTLSDFHCIISRERESFVVEDRSAHGIRVDDTLLRQGETTRLGSGSVIAFGALAFEVVLYGEAEPDLDDPDADLRLSDEAPTISSILADVAPGRQRGSGLGGTASWDEDRLPTHERQGSSTRRDDFAAPSSREVEIGWSGPPETGSMQPLLPNDWNVDTGGDYASNIEHRPALSTAVPRMGARRRARAPDPIPDIPDDAFDALAPSQPEADANFVSKLAEPRDTPASSPEESRSPSIPDQDIDPRALSNEDEPAATEPDREPSGSPLVVDESPAPGDTTEQAIADILGPPRRTGSAQAERPDRPVRPRDERRPAEPSRPSGDFGGGGAGPHLSALLRDCEDSLDEVCRLFGMEDMDAGIGSFPPQADIGARLAALTRRQTALRETLDRLLRELGPRLEPRALEARVDAGTGTVLPWPRRDYWRAYRAQFRHDGRDLSVQEFLQSLVAVDEGIDAASGVEGGLKRRR
ncbi:FHA domain-containing protein [Consotaella aegiceratis]|uniref:FHA domain-containing protein n=1 Tax=Consotaella aegiceratis TaxID=3097961 RepID=UPI002F42D36B